MHHDHDHGRHEHGVRHLHDATDWDQHYATENEGRHVWSGRPNGTLVREVAGLAPGRVLDVGCGEGADAVWLATQGWQVTGLDPSRVALDRAAAAAAEAGVEVSWVCAGLGDDLDGATYDLVSAQYPAIPRADGAAVAVLLDAVAPGGTLLYVHHEILSDDPEERPFDPRDYVMPDDVRGALDDGWVVEVDEVRERPDAPEDAHHVADVVLRARRR